MRPAKVACFGEVLWDIFEIDPPPFGARLVRAIGGAPANVATVLARLGVEVRLVGGVGRDRFGDELCQALAREGVDVSQMVRLANRTGVAFVRRDANGEPSFLFYRQGTADVSVTAAALAPSMANARFGLVGTSTLMTPGLRSATARFVRDLRAQGGALVVDLNVRAHMWPDHEEMRARIGVLARQAAVVKASEADLCALGGAVGPASRARIARGEAWLRQHAPRATYVFTRGAGPATAVSATGAFRPVEVASRVSAGRPCVDATGAGDAFIAGVIAALVEAGAQPGTAAAADAELWREALTLGHRLGQKAISRPGAVTGVVALAGCRRALDRLRRPPAKKRRPNTPRA